MDDEQIIQERKEKALSYLKKNYNFVTYAILAFIVFLSVKIRTRNLPLLRDVTTGTWTLGPDLDPFLFLRWAKYIVEHGSLFALDTMRYSPVGFNTRGELLLHPYMIAWFHKLATIFGSESVTQSAALYPVFMFALTVIAFFLFTKTIFIKSLGVKKSNIIALIATFFLATIPALMPRTIAGIPEKESAAFLFLFLAFYFFLSSWNSESKKGRYTHAILAGISTAAMALIWGGYAFIFLVIAPTVLLSFLLGKINKSKIQTYATWLITAAIFMIPFSTRYTIKGYLTSSNTGPAVFVIVVLILYKILSSNNIKEKINSTRLRKIPLPLLAVFVAIIIGAILVTIFVRTTYVPDLIAEYTDNLVKPATSRLILTVAENRQPFFTEWSGSFGPIWKGIPIFFWLLFTGSIYLFNLLVSTFRKKERIILITTYTIFLFTFIFSRYDGNSTLNGTNSSSLLLYAFGFFLFLGSIAFYYFKYFKQNKEHEFKNINFSYLLLMVFFLLGIVSARGSVRLIMILAIPGAIVVSLITVNAVYKALRTKDKNRKTILSIIAIVLVVLSFYSAFAFYQTINAQASSYAPSIYTQQWQKAMSWVRENTPIDSVFAHWWDYGYWVQSIGERATILDGGNSISYWNHFMGRYTLTNPDDTETFNFLFTHKATHFLIDSTDIGKYGAFSAIGSDETYDRQSFIQTILKNPSQTQERKDSTLFIYPAGISTDEDIIFELDGNRIFLPGGRSSLGAILIERSVSGEIISNPTGIFVYQGQQFNIPLRYAYDSDSLIDFNSGINAGVFIFPSASQSSSGEVNIDNTGALLYLSKRTVNSNLARIYLYGDESNFKLVHSEDDFLVSQIKSFNQGYTNDFVYFNGFRGPIKIWEINYPSNVKEDPKFLERSAPESISEGR